MAFRMTCHHDRVIRWYAGLIVFSILGSLLSKLTGLDPGPIAPVAGAATLGLGFCACFADWVRSGGIPARWTLAGVTLFGAAAELVGLATGWPFGEYRYEAWWPWVGTPWGPFPLLLPVAWAVVAGGCALVFPRRPGLAALAATAIDLVMEPVMAGSLGYWRWVERGPMPGDAPIMNSVGWFGVSLVAALLIDRVRSEGGPWPKWVLLGHVALTLSLGLIGR